MNGVSKKLDLIEELRHGLHEEAKDSGANWLDSVSNTYTLLQKYKTQLEKKEDFKLQQRVLREDLEIILNAFEDLASKSFAREKPDYLKEFNELNRYVKFSTSNLAARQGGRALAMPSDFDKKTVVGKIIEEWPARMDAYENSLKEVELLKRKQTEVPGALYVMEIYNKLMATKPDFSPLGEFFDEKKLKKWSPAYDRTEGLSAIATVPAGFTGEVPLALICRYDSFAVELSYWPSSQKDGLLTRAERAKANKQFFAECFVVSDSSRQKLIELLNGFVQPNYVPFCWNFKNKELIYNKEDWKANLFADYFIPKAKPKTFRDLLGEPEKSGISGSKYYSFDALAQRLHTNEKNLLDMLKKYVAQDESLVIDLKSKKVTILPSYK